MPRQFGNPITRGIYDVLIKKMVVVVVLVGWGQLDKESSQTHLGSRG